MLTIIGLGNPGARYAGTRHNAGFMGVERLREKLGAGRFKNQKKGWFSSALYEGAPCRIAGKEALLVKPLTFMNESGRAASALAPETGESLIAIHDDLDLRFGTIRVKRGGGDGGQKGVRSLIAHLETDDFVRLRIGVGHEEKAAEAADFVLSPFDGKEQEALSALLDRACEAVEAVAAEGVTAAMNRFNGKSAP